jgi:hypothetical protein
MDPFPNHPSAGIITWILLMALACFFLYFGIEVLVFAFTLKEPVPFILTLFSSNLIILISLALLVGFIFRVADRIRMKKTDAHQEKNGRTEH